MNPKRLRRWMRRYGAVGVLMAAMLYAGSAAHGQTGDDWPTLRHDARNTGYTTERIASSLRLVWRVRTPLHLLQGNISKPILLASQGVICVGLEQTSASKESLLYDRSGHLVWRIAGAAPVYLKGERLILAEEGEENGPSLLRCYNWRTKTPLWSCSLDGELKRFVGAVADGKLYCAFDLGPQKQEGNRVVIGLSLADGKRFARYQGEREWGDGPPVYDGHDVGYGTGHWLHVLDANTLEPQFAFADGGNCYPIRTGDLLIAKGWLHHINAWNLKTRKAAWQIGGPRDMVHCLTHGKQGKTLLIESSSALDVATGRRVWSVPVYAWCAAGAGNSVYLAGAGDDTDPIGAKSGGFYGVDARNGRVRWKYERSGLNGVCVIVSGGDLYGLGTDGCLYRFAPLSAGTNKRGSLLPAGKPMVGLGSARRTMERKEIPMPEETPDAHAATPEKMLPFVRDLARRSRQQLGSVLERPITPAALKEAADASHRSFDETWRTIQELHHVTHACSSGCDHCCYLTVEGSAPAIFLIADYLRAQRTPLELKRLKAHLRHTVQRIHGLNPAERVRAAVPCGLLKNNLCTIYPVRPSGCRSWNSRDVQACARVLKEGGGDLRGVQDQRPFGIVAGIEEGLAAVLRAAGFPDAGQQYELNAALLIALDHSDAAERWLAGEDVLLPARTGDGDRGYGDAVP
jgi:outer membrane protein assembly factor BamB